MRTGQYRGVIGSYSHTRSGFEGRLVLKEDTVRFRSGTREKIQPAFEQAVDAYMIEKVERADGATDSVVRVAANSL